MAGGMTAMKKFAAASVILGLSGFMGFYCLITVSLMGFFDGHSTKDYPYLYPFCLITGTACAIICLAAFFFIVAAAVMERKNIIPAKSLLISAAITILSFLAGFFTIPHILDYIGDLF